MSQPDLETFFDLGLAAGRESAGLCNVNFRLRSLRPPQSRTAKLLCSCTLQTGSARESAESVDLMRITLSYRHSLAVLAGQETKSAVQDAAQARSAV